MKSIIDAPLEFPSFDIENIEENRNTISQSLFKNIDVLVLPTTTDVTPSIEEAKTGGPFVSGEHHIGFPLQLKSKFYFFKVRNMGYK